MDAKNSGNNPGGKLNIDIWYSTDSGQSWLAKIAGQIANNGKFYWKIPYDMRFVSDKARIKVDATDEQDPTSRSSDTSDADFCPPLLSIEDLMNQVSSGDTQGNSLNGSTMDTAASSIAVAATSSDETALVPEPNIKFGKG